MSEQSPAGDSRNGPAQGQGRQLSGRAITGLTGAGLLLVFMIQNTDDIKIDFLFWSFTWPLWLYTFVIALIGAVAWVGAGVIRRHRRRKARREERRY